jgi:hypothetical protein
VIGRAPLCVPDELAGAATGLEKPLGEGQCSGVWVADPDAMLGRPTDVEGREISPRCAGDAVGLAD